MPDASAKSDAHSGLDHVLRLLRALGLAGLLGGLGALSAMWAFTTVPDDAGQWQTLVQSMRAVFYACVFSGILILIPVGGILWWRSRAVLHGQRWFRALMLMLLVTIPGLHISARLTSIALRHAVGAGETARAAALWDRLGWLFLCAFIVLLIAAWIATARPRLGQGEAQR